VKELPIQTYNKQKDSMFVRQDLLSLIAKKRETYFVVTFTIPNAAMNTVLLFCTGDYRYFPTTT